MSKNESMIASNIISHDNVVELLRITILVYNYGKTFTIEDENETIETFVNKLIKNGTTDKIGLSDTRKSILLDVAKNTPSGKVHTFISNAESDVQVGVTINKTDKRICVVFRGSESTKDWFYDLQINKIKEFNSIVEASNELHIGKSNIIGVLKNYRKTAGGFIFKYLE